ncbi:hypothetical protein BX616_004778, partial [Lobosporangium transversale]
NPSGPDIVFVLESEGKYDLSDSSSLEPRLPPRIRRAPFRKSTKGKFAIIKCGWAKADEGEGEVIRNEDEDEGETKKGEKDGAGANGRCLIFSGCTGVGEDKDEGIGDDDEDGTKDEGENVAMVAAGDWDKGRGQGLESTRAASDLVVATIVRDPSSSERWVLYLDIFHRSFDHPLSTETLTLAASFFHIHAIVAAA